MKVIVAAASLLTISATPIFAADHVAAECVSGRFEEPFCPVQHWYRGKSFVIEKREPDVIILPDAPYVVVNTPHE